jgi:hypothetical protein
MVDLLLQPIERPGFGPSTTNMPERNSRSRGDIVAVIDVGSNSGRVMVFQRDTASHLRLLAGSGRRSGSCTMSIRSAR